NIVDNQGGAPVVATATGLHTFGPYPNGTSVVITASNADDTNCVVVSQALGQIACPPVNDNCAAAINIPVNPDLSFTLFATGNTYGATQSIAASPCFGNPDDDVWFSFVATSTSHLIDIDTVVAVSGTSTDMYFQVLSGSCGSTTSLLCSDPN